MILLAGVGEDAGVHAWVQGLHTPLEDLGETGELFHLDDGHAGISDLLGGRAGGDNLHPGGVQALRELLQAGLVVHADQGAADRLALADCLRWVLRIRKFSHCC